MGPMDIFDTKNSKLAKNFQLARKLAFGLSLYRNIGNNGKRTHKIIRILVNVELLYGIVRITTREAEYKFELLE
jgi:hypothetical protein